MRSLPAPALLFAFALVLAAPARAADESVALGMRGEQLALEERCGEALALLRRARELDPKDARAAFVAGQCQIRLTRYAEAIEPLEEARRLDPELAPEATLYLGIAYFHSDDLDAAERELEAAVEALPNHAEARLYRGLVLLERADAARAVAELEAAADVDPVVDPVATYYAGMAWHMARERERAEKALQHVIRSAPETRWAREAERALEQSRARYERRRFFGSVTAGMEFDDNVVLRGTGVLLPSDISDERDGRGSFFVRGGTEFLRNADWAVGALVSYYGANQIDLTDFDTQFPRVSGWVDRALGEQTYLRVSPDFGYGWVGYDDYLMNFGGTMSLHRDWDEGGSGRFFFRGERRDYRFQIFTLAQERDGESYVGGYDHTYRLSHRTLLRGGLAGDHFDSETGEYTYSAPIAWLGATQQLPAQIVFDLRFRYSHQSYHNGSAFSPSGKRRRDDVYWIDAAIERPISQRLKMSLRYRYENDDSNVDVFNYDRNIVGGFFTVDFDNP